MARPLTKHDRNGERYTRPPDIEARIDEALALDLPALQRRMAVRDRRSSDYLPSECLVHLIRQASRHNSDAYFNLLFRALLSRCENNLRAKLRDDRAPNASYLREEVMGQLADLIAEDIGAPDAGVLDYYEVRFDQAFAALRTDIIRAEVRKGLVQMPDEEPEEDEPPSDGGLRQAVQSALQDHNTPEDATFRVELIATVNALPPDERAAVILCHLQGYAEESEDPTKRTAATICGVSGRTIRNRLKRAAEKLSRFKEDL